MSPRGEFEFIASFQQGCVVRPEGVVLGIGDDAAAYRQEPGQLGLMTTDLLVEGVHFLRETLSGAELGHKALAVNLSDIAAMGGTPTDAYISLALPEDCEAAFLDDFYVGLKRTAAEFAVNILGGDTTRSPGRLIINIALRGIVPENELLRRDAARPGDIIFCTGLLGDSRAGLEQLLAGETPDPVLRAAHIAPRPHVAEGRFLAGCTPCRTAIDISDGLSSDLGHIAEASVLGFRLYADRIPMSDALRAWCAAHGKDPLPLAFHGGEDYVLVGTLPAETADDTAQKFLSTFSRPLYLLGEMTAAPQREWVAANGHTFPLPAQGWDHFKEHAHD